MSGDPFKTPQASVLLEQHRRRVAGSNSTTAHAGNVTNLSQLLARREERKSAGSWSKRRDPQVLSSHREGEKLRNSREYYSSECDREGETSCEKRSKCGSGEGVCSAETGMEIEGVGGAAWNKLTHCMKTTSLKGTGLCRWYVIYIYIASSTM